MRNPIITIAGLGAFLMLASSLASAGISTFEKRADFASELTGKNLDKERQGFNRVLGYNAGGKPSFASTTLDLGLISLAMDSTTGVQAPRSTTLANGRKRTVNRVIGNGFMRVNKSKFARVMLVDGVDLVISFDRPVYAFGATFRGLNNGPQNTALLIDTGLEELTAVAPPKTNNERKRTFFGFVSDQAFSSIRLSGNDLFGMDRLLIGTGPQPEQSLGEDVIGLNNFAPPLAGAFGSSNSDPIDTLNQVPLPASVLLVALGLVGAISAQRLAKRSRARDVRQG